MLPLSTEATIEAMNVSTDRHQPFHTYHGNLEWKKVIQTWTPRLPSLLLSDFDILMAGYFLYTRAQANLLVYELFFIACHYSDKL